MSTQPMTRDGVRRSELRGTEPDARAVAEAVESIRLDPTEEREQVRGYAVIGVPLEHDDVLAMRRFPASSIGPGYTSVWHRSPDGRWTIYQDQDPLAACPRAFGPALDAAVETEIGLDWSGPREFAMRIDEPVELRWQVRMDGAIESGERAANEALQRLGPSA